LANNIVEVPLSDLASGASRVGISTSGHIISIREDSGIISRCSECRRVLRDGECATHGSQEGDSDVRMRLVLDDGTSTISLIVNKSASESLIGMDQQKITSEISENGTMVFVQNLRERLLGRQLKASGRTIVDEQGAMLLSDEVELIELVPELIAAELRAKWGVV
jgi:replication factor A1